MTRVSVIIPTFNSSFYILKTLESVVTQDFNDFEILVIDDGSLDDTTKIASNFLKKKQMLSNKFNYKVIREKKKGVGHARNIGIKNSKGDYIFFLDSDDLIEKSCLSKMYSKALDYNSDITFCGFDELNENLSILTKYGDKYTFYDDAMDGKNVLLDRLKAKIWICIGSAIYNKRLINNFNIEYSEELSYGEDHEFICKALFHSGRVNSVNETLVHYIKRFSSVTNTIKLNKFESIKSGNNLLNYLKIHSSNKNDIVQDYIEYVHIPKSILVTISNLVDEDIDANQIKDKLKEDKLYDILRNCKIIEISINNIKTFIEARLLGISLSLFFVYLKCKKSLLMNMGIR